MNPLKLYKLFFPMIKKEREEYLERVREKVDFYKPRMEEEIGFGLRNVQVKKHKEYFDFRKARIKKIIESKYEKFDKKFPEDTLTKSLIYCIVKGVNLIAISSIQLKQMKYEDEDALSYWNSSIYVPFGITTKLDLLGTEFLGINAALDQTVVHELAHHLWDEVKIRNFNDNGWHIEKSMKKTFKMWSEGFAEYCSSDYFKDIYPKNYDPKKMLCSPSLYKKGYKKMEELVRLYGKDIVLQVPLKWRKFGIELQKLK